MISAKVVGSAELAEALGEDSRKLPSEIAIAINATVKWTRRYMAKSIQKELRVTQKKLMDSIRQESRASKTKMVGKIKLRKESRLSLKEFGARQTKKGVTYRTSPKQGRRRVDSAFMGPRPGVIAQKLGGHVYKRKGQGRKPIQKLQGASPWGSFVKFDMKKPTVAESRAELSKQIRRRINFAKFKARQRYMRSIQGAI